MTTLLTEPHVKVVAFTPDPEALIAKSARVCYASKSSGDEADARLILSLVKRGHHSVLEHASVTFEIECSRAVANEMVRHRLAAYSQESMRYVKMVEASFCLSKGLQKLSPQMKKKLIAHIEATHDLYTELLDDGCLKEDARLILPLGHPTKIVCSWNFRECRHIIRLRGDKAALPEFRQIAKQMLDQLRELAPNVFADLSVEA